MGAIDSKTKKYVSRPNVFADLFNFLMYDGEKILKPENLSGMDPTEIALPHTEAGRSFPVQKYRDVLKNAVIMEDDEAAYVLILGAENQDQIHYAMPVKNMLYDAMNYSSQVTAIATAHKKAKDSATSAEFLSGLHKEDRLVPVITLVVYFGQQPWDGPINLHQMLSTQKEGILRFVPDYRINLISPVSMSETEIGKFKSDFKELAAFIRCGKDKDAMKELVASNENYKHMDPLTAEIANNVTKSNLKLKINEKGEVDMCKAITGIRDEGKIEGIAEGRKEGHAEGRMEGRAEGRMEGRAEGEDKLALLIQKLIANNRGTEIQRVAEDKEYRHQLMEEYGIAY